jgi:mannose-6-phosphate isomerase-like protein (cupin superfamily)
MDTTQLVDLVKVSGEGRSITLRGVTVTHKADSADTNGAWSLLEYQAPPHFEGPARHWHAQTTEAFYVLEGTLTFVIAEQTITAGPGAFVNVPPGVWHTFLNATAEPVRFLTFCSPGGFEQYFDDLLALVASEATWPPQDMGKLEALWARYDVHHEPQPASV